MYIVKRVGQALLTFVAVVSVTFALVRAMPGGPADFIRAKVMRSGGSDEISMSEINSLTETYTNIDPSTPMHVQYFNYVSSVLQGDLGESIWYNKPVAEILIDAAPWTIFLLSVSILLTFGIGIVLGAVMAYLEGTKFDGASTIGSMFLNSVPYYVAAIFMVYIVSIQLGFLPQSGRFDAALQPALTVEFVSSMLRHAVLPIVSLVITGFGGVAITMRGNAIQEIGEDYIRVAHLRGVPGRRIATRYVGRNAILPMYTNFMISIGFMFGGSVILEQIFAYEGLGYYLLDAINSKDYPLMMGGFLLISFAVLVCILVADLTYSKIDPRISDTGSREAY